MSLFKIADYVSDSINNTHDNFFKGNDMKKINYILTLLLLAVGVNWAKADDQTLALGNYDDLTAYDWDENQTYQGSWWMVAPTQLQVKHRRAT